MNNVYLTDGELDKAKIAQQFPKVLPKKKEEKPKGLTLTEGLTTQYNTSLSRAKLLEKKFDTFLKYLLRTLYENNPDKLFDIRLQILWKEK